MIIGPPGIGIARKRLAGASVRDRREGWLLWFIDVFTSLWPVSPPPPESLMAARLVSHRGEYDNHDILENTVAAFDAVRDAGVWGIECDLRWTADRVPVVFHDPDLRRLYGRPQRLRDVFWKRLRSDFSRIPSLETVIERYGRALHLMIEVKCEPYPEPERQVDILNALLSGLRPGRHYHFMTAHPEMVERMSEWGLGPLIPIAGANLGEVSQRVLAGGLAGLAGHYLMISRKRMAAHRMAGQQVGTGFVNSPACLFREIRRGVDWLFSDRAADLQGVCGG